MFPVADGTVKSLGGDQALKSSTLIRDHPIRGEVKEIFMENQRGLHHHHLKTHSRMLVKQEMISGPSLVTSFTAITLNRESNSTRQEKNHFLFHWNILTSTGLLIQPWMYCRKAASMIFGTSMDQDICLIRGQVSHNSL